MQTYECTGIIDDHGMKEECDQKVKCQMTSAVGIIPHACPHMCVSCRWKKVKV